MAQSSAGQNGTDASGSFKQQDPSAWISFDPDLTGHRKDVRSAAAKSSAAARKATIARKLALNTDCSTSRERDSSRRSKKRSRTQSDRSPASASSSSSTVQSRRPSEISLVSLGGVTSPVSSRTGSPGFMSAPQVAMPMSWEPETPVSAPTLSPSMPTEPNSLQRAVTFVLGIDAAFTQDTTMKEPTHFGASRIKSHAISTIHEAVAQRRPGSATLLAVALLAAWDLVSTMRCRHEIRAIAHDDAEIWRRKILDDTLPCMASIGSSSTSAAAISERPYSPCDHRGGCAHKSTVPPTSRCVHQYGLFIKRRSESAAANASSIWSRHRRLF